MKKSIIIISSLILLSFILTSSTLVNRFGFVAYKPGEEIKYRVHYGFFNAGEALMRLSNQQYIVNNKVCYKAEVIGNSTGAFDKIVRIRDVWGSYFDTVGFQPQKSFRNIQENRYRKNKRFSLITLIIKLKLKMRNLSLKKLPFHRLFKIWSVGITSFVCKNIIT